MLWDDQVSPTTQEVGALLALSEESPGRRWIVLDYRGPFDDARNSKRRRLEKKVRKTEHLFSCKKNEQAKKKKKQPTYGPSLPGSSRWLSCPGTCEAEQTNQLERG